uniref:FATP synthase c subunit lysine N-methyltransferase n=1 Tax=Oryzias latipes TaxID=8090 RepID=A0A3P9IN54_ORYLA
MPFDFDERLVDSRQLDEGVGERSRRSRVGLVITGAIGGSLVALYAVAAPFVAPALRKVCLPFVPATTAQVQNVLQVLRRRSGTLVDIGSGDGRIVIAAAKQGFQASGLELNPWLVWYSRYKAWREGVLLHSVTRTDKNCTNCCFYCLNPIVMDQLELKLAHELPRTAKVVACRFPFPTWVPECTAGEGIDTWTGRQAGTGQNLSNSLFKSL